MIKFDSQLREMLIDMYILVAGRKKIMYLVWDNINHVNIIGVAGAFQADGKVKIHKKS